MKLIQTDSSLADLNDTSPDTAAAMSSYIGHSTANVHIRICGPAMGHNVAMNYSAICMSIFDAMIANNAGRKGASDDDPAASAAHSIAKAVLMRAAREQITTVLDNDTQGTYSYLSDAIRIYPSKEPLEKLMTDEIDHEIVEKYFSNYSDLKEAEEKLLRKASERLDTAFVPALSLSGCSTLSYVSEEEGRFGQADHTSVKDKVVRWIDNNVSKLGAKDSQFSRIVRGSLNDVPVHEVVAIANFINSHLQAVKLSGQSVTTTEIANCLAQAVNNHSSIALNVPLPFEFREFTISPMLTRESGKIQVNLSNTSFTGDHPTMWVGERADCPYTLRNSDVVVEIAQSDCSVFAYLIGRFIIAHAGSKNTDASVSLSLDDLLIDYRALVSEDLYSEVIYRILKSQVRKIMEDKSITSMRMFELMKNTIAMKHSQDNVAKFQTLFTEMVREGAKTFSNLVRSLIDHKYSVDVGVVMDELKAKYGQKESWIFCSEKDELELSFNGGSAAAVMKSGCPSFRGSRGLQFIKDWPVGTTEGCTEAVYVRDRYITSHFKSSVSQDAVNSNLTDVTKYFHAKSPNLTLDLTGASAMAYLNSFKLGDRFYTNEQTPDVIMFSDVDAMSRTCTEGEGEMFRTQTDLNNTYRLNGSATVLEECTTSYRSVDRSVAVGSVGSRGATAVDTLHSLAAVALRVIVTDLLHGYYSNMLPAVKGDRGLKLEQTQKKALDRMNETFFSENYVQVAIDYARVTRFKNAPVLSKTYGNLFPSDELFEHRSSDMFVRRDLIESWAAITKLHVNAIKHYFPGVPVVDFTLRFLDGQVTEQELRDMKRESRGIDVINMLVEMVVKASGFVANEGVIVGDSHLAIRIACLNLLIAELKTYGDGQTGTLEGDFELGKVMSL